MPELKIIPDSNIMYRHWSVADPKAVLLFVHGLGAHSERWDFMANFLVNKKYSSYAIELMGFGETKGVPGHIDSFNQYFQDIKELYQLAKQECPNKKIFLLGESLGGLISFLLASEQPDLFAGLILISPAFKNAMTFSFSSYLQFIPSLFYNHQKPVDMPFTAAMCTRDVSYQQKMDADKREIRVASTRMLLNIMFGQIKAKKAAKNMTIPSLFLLSGKDYLVDPKESRKVFQTLAAKDKKLLEYPDMLHALSIDLERERVFEDILSWLNHRI